MGAGRRLNGWGGGRAGGGCAPDYVGSSLVALAQHIEEESIHVVVQRLVVQEQLGQVAQVLAVDLLLPAVDLELHTRAEAPSARRRRSRA